MVWENCDFNSLLLICACCRFNNKANFDFDFDIFKNKSVTEAAHVQCESSRLVMQDIKNKCGLLVKYDLWFGIQIWGNKHTAHRHVCVSACVGWCDIQKNGLHVSHYSDPFPPARYTWVCWEVWLGSSTAVLPHTGRCGLWKGSIIIHFGLEAIILRPPRKSAPAQCGSPSLKLCQSLAQEATVGLGEKWHTLIVFAFPLHSLWNKTRQMWNCANMIWILKNDLISWRLSVRGFTTVDIKYYVLGLFFVFFTVSKCFVLNAHTADP